MEKKKSRLRAPNYTNSENLLLCDIVTKYKNVIENRKTDGVNLQEKHKAWLEIVKEFNSNSSGFARTLESLQQNYKNLKKKAKKDASDKKMDIPVDRAMLVLNMEEYGINPTSNSCDWEKVAQNTGASEEVCQEMFKALTKEAETKDRILKKNIMGTGGGPAPNNDKDPVLEKVKVLVGPVIDGMYSIYDGDSSLMASQSKQPIEYKNLEYGSLTLETVTDAKDCMSITEDAANIQDGMYFTNDRANLKKKPHHLLTRKRKLETATESKQTVGEKFKTLASEKMELVELQKELLRIQIQEEKEKVEHNRQLRALEMEETKRKYEHNDNIRKLELERLNFKENLY